MRRNYLFLGMTFILACNSPLEKSDQSEQNSHRDSASVSKKITEDNHLAALQIAWEKILPPKDYIVDGKVKTEILIYSDCMMGDIMHYSFKDETGKTYNFSANDTKFQLEQEAKVPSEINGGYEANVKYKGKKFRVAWRRIRLNREPTEEQDIYYMEYDQIIYLEEVK